MSKATYHVPQPGEQIEFHSSTGAHFMCVVGSWDSKHGILTTIGDQRIHIKDRSSIKLVEPAKEEPHFAYAPAENDVIAPTEHTTTLPTSFASEVERAHAIADAEAEEKKRSEAATNEMNRLADEIVVLANKRRDVMAANEDAEEDHRLRVNYLRSLRVRGE